MAKTITGAGCGTDLDRRRLLVGAAAGAMGIGAFGLTAPSARAQTVKTSARIVIAGAGAAGLSAAARLAARLDGAKITLIDARKAHYYQPGFSLIAAGLKPASYAVSATADYVPRDVDWIEAEVAEFDPTAKTVTTSTGQKLGYDYLIVATGLRLDFAGIAGMDEKLIGQNGLGCVYAGPEAAAATAGAMARYAETGGVGLFGRPATEMKCAGAPLKNTFLTDDALRRRGTRGKAEIVYAAQNQALFSVPIVSEKVRMLFKDRGVKVAYEHVMTAIDPGKKVATYATPKGPVEMAYAYCAVIPPMRAPLAVKNSPLAFAAGPLAADGWVEADKTTLRHPRFPTVFAVGDIAGVPKGKTAASVKWQVPVAVDHIVADIAGTKSSAVYTGYTSCPLITRYGQAMLVEFDYDNNLVPSFPGVIAPLEELWITWVMKTIALKPTYLAMLHGRA